MFEGSHNSREGRTLGPKLSSLGSNLDSAINCRPVVSHVGIGINVCTVSRKDVNLEDQSASNGC